jgi:LysM repeat protein
VGRLRLVDRRQWARWVAPAVVLLAVTGIVLLVRSALGSDTPAATSTAGHVTTTARPASRLLPPRVAAQYYVIRAGDTLDAIAGRFATTVDKLLVLNPGVEPTTLRPGQRLRIK